MVAKVVAMAKPDAPPGDLSSGGREDIIYIIRAAAGTAGLDFGAMVKIVTMQNTWNGRGRWPAAAQ